MAGPKTTEQARVEPGNVGLRSQRSGLSSAFAHASSAQRGLDTSGSAVTEAWLRQAADARGNESKQEGTTRDASDGAGNRNSAEDVSGSESVSYVVEEFNKWRSDPDLAMAVAAIKALTGVIKRSEASTMMGLEIELKKAAELLKKDHKTSISLSAGCDLFMRHVTRTSALEFHDLEAGKARLIERGERFGEISLKVRWGVPSQSRETIASLGCDFVRDGCTILVHGFSRVVLALLLKAKRMKHFNTVITECRPDGGGIKMAEVLSAAAVPVTVILDAAVAYMMERVDLVLVGADGVVESGGIMNTLGTYQVAVVAKAMNKPVYVAAESYKFARMYPLDQRDLEAAPHPVDFGVPIPKEVHVDNNERDYTPPQYLTLLFTDLGVLTPSAVSDELIQLYL